ncbi:P-type DNA transfer ATPase VirB11 [Gallibacterium anatis]|uniref:P-type DNA transfer ATPase VirB11 n=1 Tax=Gallibacterium anatis TaxID=750 RepID=UPI003006256B
MNINTSLIAFTEKLFGELFNDPKITEIKINHPNLILYETETGERFKGNDEQNARVTLENLEYFTNALSSNANQKSDQKKPILGTTLPTGERIQIVRPPAVDPSQFSITIRKPMKLVKKLSEYKSDGFFDEIVMNEHSITQFDRELAHLLDKGDFEQFFYRAVESGTMNMVIAGATGSGKTTFFKACMQAIPEDERLITIEDVRELYSEKHYDVVNLLYPSEIKDDGQVTPTALLKSCLRMKPDRILLAELRGAETYDYINIISSGHGGSITTLHAGTKEEAIRRLTLMSMQHKTGANIPYEITKSTIEETIDVIATVGRVNGKRCITSLHWKNYTKVKAIIESEK